MIKFAIALQFNFEGGLTAIFSLTFYDILTPIILKFVQGVELKRYAMTPGIDFINHDSRMTDRANVAFEYFSEKFVVRCGEDYNPGDEVFISYGSQSNDSFLQYYGFVEANNPADTFAFDDSISRMLGVKIGSLIARPNGFDQKTINSVTKKFKGDRKAARTTLRELCAAQLSSMPTTLETDEALLPTADQHGIRYALAVRYRIEKKKLLLSIAAEK